MMISSERPGGPATWSCYPLEVDDARASLDLTSCRGGAVLGADAVSLMTFCGLGFRLWGVVGLCVGEPPSSVASLSRSLLLKRSRAPFCSASLLTATLSTLLVDGTRCAHLTAECDHDVLDYFCGNLCCLFIAHGSIWQQRHRTTTVKHNTMGRRGVTSHKIQTGVKIAYFC